MKNERKPFPFVCERKFGELVMFCPGDKKDGEFPGIIEGVTMLKGKVSFHIILTTGANVTTYGERVHDLETVLSKEDTDFLFEALYERG